MSVKFVGDYDEQIDSGLMEVVADTAGLFGRLESDGPGASYECNRAFYEETLMQLKALTARARAGEVGLDKKSLTTLFVELTKQFESLQAQHRDNGLGNQLVRQSTGEAMELSLSATLTYLVFLKRTQSTEGARQMGEAAGRERAADGPTRDLLPGRNVQ